MKKMLVLVLAVAMVCVVAACGSGAEKDIIGTWKLSQEMVDSFKESGVEGLPDEDWRFEYRKDGTTAEIKPNGEIDEREYVIEGDYCYLLDKETGEKVEGSKLKVEKDKLFGETQVWYEKVG